MRFYIAGRAATGMQSVAKLVRELERRGHEVLFDWTEGVDVRKPYMNYVAHNRPIAEQMRSAAINCDISVLLWTPNLEGALWEAGMALAASVIVGPKRCFVLYDGVEKETRRQSIFHTLPEVTLLSSIDEFLKTIDRAF